MSKNVNWSTVLLLIVLAGFVGYGTSAHRAGAPLQPALIATVDLERLFRNLDERSAADTRLTAVAEGLDADGMRKREAIELMGQDLELFTPGSDQYQQAAQDLAKKGFELQAFLDFAVRKLDGQKSRALRNIYDRIKETIDEIARENAYDVVFVDDSVVALPSELAESEMMRQISARRILYSNEEIDITDDVIARMNVLFAANGG